MVDPEAKKAALLHSIAEMLHEDDDDAPEEDPDDPEARARDEDLNTDMVAEEDEEDEDRDGDGDGEEEEQRVRPSRVPRVVPGLAPPPPRYVVVPLGRVCCIACVHVD